MNDTAAKTRRVAVHFGWAVAAAGTFAAGLWLGHAGSRSPETAEARPASPARSIAASRGGSDAAPAGSSISEAAAAVRSSRGSTATPRAVTAEEIRALAEEALRDPNQLNRTLAFSKLLESLTAENALDVLASLEELGANRSEWELFRYAWAAKDGETAVEQAMSLEGRARYGALHSTLQGWASSEPDAAIAWLDQIKEPEERERLLSGVIGGLADHDIGLATDYVYKLAAEGNERAVRYFDDVAREQLRKSSPLEAARWAESLPDGDLKGEALEEVAGSLFRDDPAAAAEWAAKFAATDFGVGAIEEIGEEWAEREPENAIPWLEKLPQGAAQAEGLESAFDEWVRRDPRAASEYLAKMRPSPARDAAIHGFVGELSEDDPVSAIAWADAIQQPEVQQRALTRIAREWIRRDESAALEWLPNSGIPMDVIEEQIITPQRRGNWRG